MKQIMRAHDINLSHSLTSNDLKGLSVTLRVDTDSGNQVEFSLPPVLVKNLISQLLPQLMSACSMVYGLEAQDRIARRR